MKYASQLRIAVFFALLSVQLLSGQSAAPSPDPVMRAMTDELQRSVSELQFKDLEKPYFIQYIVLDQDQYRSSATFGALTASNQSQSRYIQAQVRVGDYIEGGNAKGNVPMNSKTFVPAALVR